MRWVLLHMALIKLFFDLERRLFWLNTAIWLQETKLLPTAFW